MYKLGTTIQAGSKILLDKWYTILAVDEDGIYTKKGKTMFGDMIRGWKSK